MKVTAHVRWIAAVLAVIMLVFTACTGDPQDGETTTTTSGDTSASQDGEGSTDGSGDSSTDGSGDSITDGSGNGITTTVRGDDKTTNPKDNKTTTSPQNTTTTTSTNGGSTQEVVTVDISQYESAGDDAEVLNTAFSKVANLSLAADLQGKNTKYVLKLKNKTYKIDATLYLKNANNMEIDGNGAKLVWTRIVPGVEITGGKNVLFKNLSVDYDPLPFTQGVVASINGSTVVVTIDKGYSMDVDQLNSTQYKDGTIYLNIHDRETGGVAVDTCHTYSFKNAKKVSSNQISLTKNWGGVGGGRALAVGDVVSVFPFGCNVFSIKTGNTIDFTNVNVYGGNHSAFRIEGGVGNNHFTNVKVVPGDKPKGATQERLKSVGGDAIHIANVAVGPTLNGCTITHCGDDNMNVHGYFYHVLKVEGKTITVTPKWNNEYEEGETIAVYDADSYVSKGTAKITKFTSAKDPSLKNAILAAYANCYSGLSSDTLVYIIELDKQLNIKVGDHINSLDSIGSGMTVRNCTMGYTRARGILVRGSNVLIENNTFIRTSGPGVMIKPELSWCEGGFSTNVTIRNNKFKDTSTASNEIYNRSSQIGAVTIGIGPELNGPGGFFQSYELKDITVEGNTFENSRVYAVSALNCNGITIKNNTIINPFSNGLGVVGSEYSVKPNSAILVAMSKDITVTGNKVTGARREITQAVEIHSNCTGRKVNSGNTLSNK